MTKGQLGFEIELADDGLSDLVGDKETRPSSLPTTETPVGKRNEQGKRVTGEDYAVNEKMKLINAGSERATDEELATARAGLAAAREAARPKD